MTQRSGQEGPSLPRIALDKPQPLYHQVKEHLKAQINRGRYRPGEKLPTEEELCRRYRVSRITVRRALTELAQEGLLSSVQGSGRYVNDRLGDTVTLRAMVTEASWVQPLRQAVRQLNRFRGGEHLNLEVAVVGRPQLRSKIIAAVAQGEAPDLALLDWVWMAEFIALSYLQPLDELDPMWVQSLKADLFPIFIEKNSYQGQLYGVQTDASVAVLWYRKDWLQAEGFLPPRTWDELVRLTQHFKREPVRGKYGLQYPLLFPAGLRAAESTTYHLVAFIHAAGERLLREGRICLGTGTVQTLRFLRDLVHRYRVTPPEVIDFTWDEAPRRFGQGQAVLAFSGSYAKPLIQQTGGWDDETFRAKVGFVPIPAGPTGQPATVAGGMVYGLFRQSKHLPEALEVLKRVASPELMRDFCRRTGRKPTRISVVRQLHPERDWFLHQTAQLLNIAQIRPALPEYTRISEQLRLMMEDVIAQRRSVAAAVEKTQAIIDAFVRRP